ncbi:MAG TPA: hypothetical protein VD840_08295 [Sinorhizobium sp.]|nr:hypothetical protein [Sinorhizobium sp.]
MRKRRRQLLVAAGGARVLGAAALVWRYAPEHGLRNPCHAALRVIDPALAPVLADIHRHNPLLFDFVLKRHLSSAGKRLAPAVFETRRFFAP